MREIASVRACLFCLPFGMFEQLVELLHQRFNFGRKRFLDPVRPGASQLLDCCPHPAQR